MFALGSMSLLLLVITLAGIVLPILALVLLASTPAGRRSLPLVAWVLIIVAFPFLGSIAFLVCGRR